MRRSQNFAHTHTGRKRGKIFPDKSILTSSKDLNAIQHNLSEDINSLASWFRDNEFIINLKKGKIEVMLFGTAKGLKGLCHPHASASQ